MSKKHGKTRQNPVKHWPGPIPRAPTHVRTVSRTHHTPGTPPLHHGPQCTGSTALSSGSTARTRSPGFFRIQSATHNTDLSKTDTFLRGQKRPVQNDTFLSKSLPNPHINSRKCRFCCFWLKSAIFSVFRDTSGFDGFSPFLRYQVFPRVLTKKWCFWRIFMKNPKNHQNGQNVTDKPDIWEMVRNVRILTIFWHFWHFP